MVTLVHMIRESDGKTADVHPAEVENYRAGGFEPIATPEEAAEAAGSLAGLRKAYRERYGKAPNPRWNAGTLAKKLEAEG